MFSREVLRVDAPRAVEQIARAIRDQVLGASRRCGGAVGISGGTDGSVGSRVLGRDRVLEVDMASSSRAAPSRGVPRIVVKDGP
jgi:NH3-dependent NAD+ synthetase